MRDSMGAAYIFGLSLTFTILFVGFLSISINYAKAFQIKSKIVSRLEENEGYTGSLEEPLVEYLKSEGYNASGICEQNITTSGDKEWELANCISFDGSNTNPAGGAQRCNACIYKETSPAPSPNNTCATRDSYRVVTFFKFDLPIIKYYTSFKVAGESRYIYDYAACEPE